MHPGIIGWDNSEVGYTHAGYRESLSSTTIDPAIAADVSATALASGAHCYSLEGLHLPLLGILLQDRLLGLPVRPRFGIGHCLLQCQQTPHWWACMPKLTIRCLASLLSSLFEPLRFLISSQVLENSEEPILFCTKSRTSVASCLSSSKSKVSFRAYAPYQDATYQFEIQTRWTNRHCHRESCISGSEREWCTVEPLPRPGAP